jgi:hypothetical protein
MIDLALNFLKGELSRYIDANKRIDDTIDNTGIVINNISSLENDSNSGLKNKVVITLVNLEEESSLKNVRHNSKVVGGIRYMEPAVYLNLYILISATLGEQEDAYEFALNRLSLVIQFFQTKRQFSVANSPFFDPDGLTADEKEELQLNVELYTLTFEQINHLWGSLGGKQVPSVLYKIRLVKIQERTGIEAPLIEEVENNILHKTNI